MTSDREQRKEALLKIFQHGEQQRPDFPEEQDVITQCQSNNQTIARRAFNRLIHQYQDSVYTYISYIVPEHDVAFNLARNTFVQAYLQLSQIPDDLSVKAWLLKLAKQCIGTVYHKQATQAHQSTETDTSPEQLRQSRESTCQDIRSLLSDYLDGELDETETTRVETHLTSCEQCCQEYGKLLKNFSVVHRFARIPAPANLQEQINAVLDQEPLGERLLSELKQLVNTLLFSVSQIVQQLPIRQMETELLATRSLEQFGLDSLPVTFVIFTGKIVSEGMPLDAGKYVASLIPDPAKAPQPLFIPGNLTDVGNQIETYLASLPGKFTEESIQKETLTIRKITAELPQNTPTLLALFLQTAFKKSPEQPEVPNIPTVSIEIYLIDQR